MLNLLAIAGGREESSVLGPARPKGICMWSRRLDRFLNMSLGNGRGVKPFSNMIRADTAMQLSTSQENTYVHPIVFRDIGVHLLPLLDMV
jgi:hypothetical protein